MTYSTADTPSFAAPGWYPVDPNGGRERGGVRYWDGAAWRGPVRPSNPAGSAPRDSFGQAALWLLIGGVAAQLLGLFVGLPVLSGLGPLSVLASLVLAIIGFVKGRIHGYRTPSSVGVLIANIVLFILVVLIIIAGIYLLSHIHI